MFLYVWSDNVVNMANRTAVNHRMSVASDTVHQPRAAPVTTMSNVRADVSFKRLAFYDVLAEVMKPSSLGLPDDRLLQT